jgi:hypothetical protein
MCLVRLDRHLRSCYQGRISRFRYALLIADCSNAACVWVSCVGFSSIGASLTISGDSAFLSVRPMPPYLPMPLREFPEVPFDFARYRV